MSSSPTNKQSSSAAERPVVDLATLGTVDGVVDTIKTLWYSYIAPPSNQTVDPMFVFDPSTACGGCHFSSEEEAKPAKPMTNRSKK